MRPGFLVQQAGVQTGDAAQQSVQQPSSGTAAAAAQPPAHAAAAATSGAPPPQRTPEQLSAGLAECLELLKGPSDERRFVGLLLVTKLLPAGDDATIRSVHAAVGPTFLARLLLPLSSRAPPPTGGEAAQKAAASCALGLAVLSSFVRVSDLAGSPEVLEKLPLLLNVVRCGGIGPLLAARTATAGAAVDTTGGAGAGSAEPPLTAGAICDAASDAAAVQDALECAVAAARSGEDGRAVAADSGGLAAAAAVLQRCPADHTQQLSLALQLLAALLADEQRRAEVQGDPATVLRQLLPALARVFALPAQQLQHGGGERSGASGPQADQQLQERLLAVQLEALHVLLLLLPLPHLAHLPAEQLGGAGGGAAWLAQLRQGLALLLRGRVSAVQRHSALQLAAAVVDLAGPDWLLGGGDSGSASSGRSSGSGISGGGSVGQKASATDGQAFFQLLVEITKVETSVLLHDALAPDVPVPLASAAGASAADWRPPAARRPAGDACSSDGSEAGDGLDDVGAELAADLAGTEEGSQAADLEPLVRVLHSEQDRRQLEAQLQREQAAAQAAADAAAASGGSRPREQMQPAERMQQVDDVQIPTDMRWEGPTEAAGARAARVLPACFGLLEACIEALAADTQRAEAMLDGSAPIAALSDAVAQRALFSLQEAVEVVLQFIEQTCEEMQEEQEAAEAGATAAGAAALVRRALLLAALRALARFCAEVPEALGGRLRPLLPALLPLRAELGSAAEMEGGGPPAEGASFLLPLLLQVSEPGYGEGGEQQAREHQLWLQALGEPAVLSLLARYAQQCAAACAQVSTSAADSAADDALLYACQLLLNVTSGGQHASDSSSAAADRRRQLAAAAEAGPLLSGLAEVAAHRGQALTSPHSSPDQVVHAVRLLTTVAALASSLVAQLAADLPPGQRPQQAAGPAGQQLPPLGPLSSQLLASLCSQLLTALHAAAALLAPEPLSRRLSAGLALDAATLAAARAAVAEDEALQLELAQSLDSAGANAAELLSCYQPLAPLARRHPLVAAGLGAAEAAAAAASQLPDGLMQFLAAAGADESA